MHDLLQNCNSSTFVTLFSSFFTPIVGGTPRPRFVSDTLRFNPYCTTKRLISHDVTFHTLPYLQFNIPTSPNSYALSKLHK
jgi:hypothetical protein